VVGNSPEKAFLVAVFQPIYEHHQFIVSQLMSSVHQSMISSPVPYISAKPPQFPLDNLMREA
jgi:hypothetical protein